MNKPHLKVSINKRITLPRSQSWDKSFHVFDEESALAIEMAAATGRPLLVRGEPGIGKSQLARAAAAELKRYFISEVVHIAIEGQDLLWRYDPVARLNDAQSLAAQAVAENCGTVREDQSAVDDRQKGTKQEDLLHPKYYISPGVLWWVFDCQSAQLQHEACRHPFYQPRISLTGANQGEDDTQKKDKCESGVCICNIEQVEKQGFVLLIDEIDKADPSMPNALLEVLGNGGFHVPVLNESVGLRNDVPKPLVIITTNEERELPPAFIRRCLVLNLTLDDEKRLRAWWSKQSENEPGNESGKNNVDVFDLEKVLTLWLSNRAEVHFPGEFSDLVKDKVAELLIRDRNKAKLDGTVKPGQAEYLDLLRALKEMTDPREDKESRVEDQLKLLQKISPYALEKAPLE